MSEDRRAVVVGLDVHKSSVRLAAVRDGELLRERTLGYDHEQLLREVRAWPGARVCQEAGPTGFGLHRAPEDRCRMRTGARRVCLGDRHRAATANALSNTIVFERGAAGDLSQKENPRNTYAAPGSPAR
jgi:hypothetical protein